MKLAHKKLQQQRQMQAALIPQKSDGGTKVVFDNSPLPIIKKIPKEKPKKIDKKLIAKKTHKQKKHNKKKLVLKKKLAQKKLAQKKKIIEAIKQTNKHTEHQKTVSKVPAKKVKKVTTKFVKNKQIKKQIQKQKIHKQATLNLLQTKKILEKLQDKKEVKPIEKKKKSLFSLMKSFFKHEKGNSSMMRQGENRFPGLEEMKYISYEKSVQDAIIASCRSLLWQLNNLRPQDQPQRPAKIDYYIDKNGIQGLRLIESSGSRVYDEICLIGIQQANIPPIPKHLGVEKYHSHGGTILLK